jgi:hypothetical protein
MPQVTLGPIAAKYAKGKAAALLALQQQRQQMAIPESPVQEPNEDELTDAQRQSAWNEFANEQLSDGTQAAYQALYPRLYGGRAESALADMVDEMSNMILAGDTDLTSLLEDDETKSVGHDDDAKNFD